MIAGASWFGHDHSRRLIAAFGQLFSEMTIVRRNSDGSVREIIENVPIENFVHDKFYERHKIQKVDDEGLGTRAHMVFPRMTYGLIGMTYRSDRQQSVQQRFLTGISGEHSKARVTLTPAPWDFEFELKIAARNFSDLMAIVEQILPHFRPSHTLVMRDHPFVEDAIDVPIFLDSLQWSDSAEEEMEEGSRQVIATLSFHAQYHLYGPTGSLREIEVKHMLDEKHGRALTDPKGVGKLINKTIIEQYSLEENFYTGQGDMRITQTQTTPSSPLVIDFETPPTEARET